MRTFLEPLKYSFPVWYLELLLRLHPSDLCLSKIFLKAGVQVAPPFEEHGFADQLEPRCELERLVLKHGLQLFLSNEAGVTSFVGVDVKIDIGLYEEDVVNCASVSIALRKGLSIGIRP